MNYEKVIIDLLFAAGEDGLAVKDISRYVFNANNSFFSLSIIISSTNRFPLISYATPKRPILSSEKVRKEARIV